MSKFADKIRISENLHLVSVHISQSVLFFEVIKMSKKYFSEIEFISPDFDSVKGCE